MRSPCQQGKEIAYGCNDESGKSTMIMLMIRSDSGQPTRPSVPTRKREGGTED